MNSKIGIDENDLICSICKEPFIEPIFIPSCGHHSCRQCLKSLIKTNMDNNKKCSVCLTPFNNLVTDEYINSAKPNLMITNLVNDAFSVVCDNDGCDEKVLEYLQDLHDKTCPHLLVKCKNFKNGCRLNIKRQDKQTHLNTCLYHGCDGKSYGCNFVGSLKEIKKHNLKCMFNSIGSNIEKKITKNVICYINNENELQEQINKINQNIAIISRKITTLTRENRPTSRRNRSLGT
jgi:hypothetical protein